MTALTAETKRFPQQRSTALQTLECNHACDTCRSWAARWLGGSISVNSNLQNSQSPVSPVMSTESTPNTSNPPSRIATPNRFANHTDTLEDALKNHTVGLVHLADFKKRRTELAERRDREAAEKFQSAGTSRGGSGRTSREGSTGPDKAVRKKRKPGVDKGKLSFGGDDEDEAGGGTDKEKSKSRSVSRGPEGSDDGEIKEEKRRKFNPKLKAPPPKALTKSTLLREAQEREMLRREFLQLQEKIKNEEITIPFVFYDGMAHSSRICTSFY